MIYLVIINVLGFLIMGLDKAKAKKQKYRISENAFCGFDRWKFRKLFRYVLFSS